MGILSFLFGGRNEKSRGRDISPRYIREFGEFEDIRDIEPDRSVSGEVLAELDRQLNRGGCVEKSAPAAESLIAVGRRMIDDAVQAKREREETERKRSEAASSSGGGTRYSLRSDYIRFSRREINSYAAVQAMIDKNKAFGRVLMRLVNERCEGCASRCYERAGVSRQVYSKIISEPDRGASKRTVMQLAIGLRLTYVEAVRFLSFAGYAFTDSSFEDMAFAWCLKNSVYSLFDLNDLLVRGDCTPIQIN